MDLSILNPDRGLGLFTDGSCYHKDRNGGWAWIAYDAYGGVTEGFGSETDTTISRMELTAAVEGLNALAGLDPPGVIVYSDSEYVVKGTNDRSRSRRLNVDLWLALDQAREAMEYTEFHHVRGHQDSYYNNRADELAGEARLSLLVKAEDE